MSVFLHGDLKSAQELLAQKVLFRDLERAYADSHLGRLAGNTLREHRDVVAAPRPHLRPQAHQLAHLLDRLPDPRGGRRARAHAAQGAGAPPLRLDDDAHLVPGEMPPDDDWPKRKPERHERVGLKARIRRTHEHRMALIDLRHLHPVRPQGRPRVRRRARDPARARAADRRARRGSGRVARAGHRRAAARPRPPAERPGRDADAARRRRPAPVRRAAVPARRCSTTTCSRRSGCTSTPSATCARRAPSTTTRCRSTRSAASRCRAASSRRTRPTRFIAQPHAADAVDVRLWDDLAKVAGAPTPPLAHFVPMLEAAQRSPT